MEHVLGIETPDLFPNVWSLGFDRNLCFVHVTRVVFQGNGAQAGPIYKPSDVRYRTEDTLLTLWRQMPLADVYSC